MIVNKVKAFWTEKDQEELKKINEGWERIEELEGEELYNCFMALSARQKKLYADIEQRYLDSFGGDQEALLAEIQEIISLIEKKDFQRYYRFFKTQYREILALKPQKPKYKSGELKPHHQEGEETVYMFEQLPTAEEDTSAQYELYKAAKLLASASFEGCRNFILSSVVDIQLRGLDDEHQNRAAKMAEDKAAEWYNRPKKYAPIKEIIAPPVYQPEVIDGALCMVPSTNAFQFSKDAMGMLFDDRYADRRKAYNHSALITQESKSGIVTLTYKKDAELVSVTFNNIDSYLETKPARVKQLFNFIAHKVYRQGLVNGTLVKDTIRWPLYEYMDIFGYKSAFTARRAFADYGLPLLGMIVGGERQTPTGKLEQARFWSPFNGIEVDKKECIVYLNPNFEWGYFTSQYTALPEWYFSIKNSNALELTDYIFYRARQNVKEIKENGCFYISYENIRNQLHLTDESGKNPGRIKEGIRNAALTVMDMYMQYENPYQIDGNYAFKDFNLEMDEAIEDAPLQSYLTNGKLKVTISGAYAKKFIRIGENTAKRIKAAEKTGQK